jgi:hypothetical protein
MGLDRILDKSKVIAFDKKLKKITRRFKPLNWKKHIFILFTFLTMFSFYMTIITAPSFSYIVLLLTVLWFIWVLAVLFWMLIGGLWAYLDWKKDPSVPVEFVPAMAIVTPFLFIGFAIAAFIKFCLYPLIYPLKGILILNNRWFNSFSGLIGLVLSLIGTILQFI